MAIIFLDPGGDAVQTLGYFSSTALGVPSYDTVEKVVGLGSYKFDSGAGGDVVILQAAGVMDVNRRTSLHVRYNATPDLSPTATQFPSVTSIYSGGGFTDADSNLVNDNGLYATATPAQNSGQGTVCENFFGGMIPVDAIIDSVKIIYERKYDTELSVGISRVKYRINGVEGPDYDNTDMPTTDTVVTVDVTADRGWTQQDLRDDSFDVIVEARRGDTLTPHTQSWDYVKVEVAYHMAAYIVDVTDGSGTVAFQIGLSTKGSNVVVRLNDGAGNTYDGITEIPPNTWARLGFSYTLPAVNDLNINIFVNDIPELSIVGASTAGLVAPANLRYGWITSPGANKVLRVDCIHVDDGGTLDNLGNKLSTAKLPATVNEDNFDTTGGTGAVGERPIDLANYRQQAASAQVRQSYTLQTAATGDVDLTGKTLVGHMGWVIAKKTGLGGAFSMTVNGVDSSITLTTSPAFKRAATTSASYPSNAAGIGMVSATGSQDTFFYEGGVVVAYDGPANADVLFARQEVSNETLPTIIDDLRAAPPSTYEVCYVIDEFSGLVTMKLYSVGSDGAARQLHTISQSNGGSGRTNIPPGIEVQIDVEITGITNLMIYRRINV